MTDTLPGGTSILLVDDDPDLLLLLSKMLSRIGAATAIAETGTQGLKMLNQGAYDLVILDLMLPDMSGFDVLKTMRQDDRHDRVPVIILSALADPDTISKGLELGADGYLTKPYLPNTLTSRVRAVLARGRRTS